MPSPQTLSASVKIGALVAGPLWVSLLPRSGSTIEYVLPFCVVDNVTVPLISPVPVPSAFCSVLQLSSTLPLCASTYVSVPVGCPLAARPETFTW